MANLAMHAMSLDPYMDVPGQVYFTTNEMLETDPDVCLAYMRAVKKAVQVIQADETGAASIEAMMPFAFPELDTPEAATLTLQAEKELWVARGDEGIGKIYPEAFAKGCAGYQENSRCTKRRTDNGTYCTGNNAEHKAPENRQKTSPRK